MKVDYRLALDLTLRAIACAAAEDIVNEGLPLSYARK